MQRLSIRLDLEDEIAHKFKVVKEKLGFPTNKAVVIYLINDRFDMMKHNPVAKRGA